MQRLRAWGKPVEKEPVDANAMLPAVSASSRPCGARRGRRRHWPTKPITIVVATGGGGFDLMARMTAPLLSAKLACPLRDESRSGSELIAQPTRSASRTTQHHSRRRLRAVLYADINEFHDRSSSTISTAQHSVGNRSS